MTSFDACKPIFSSEYIKENYPKYEPTGFAQLDKLLCGGFAPSLIVLGAISSLGKSTFALQLAQNISSNGKPVLYFSLEMTRHAISMKSMERTAFRKLKMMLQKTVKSLPIMLIKSSRKKLYFAGFGK